MDLGIYCVQFIDLVHRRQEPERIVATGHLDDEEGTDKDVSAIFSYANGQTARMQTHSEVDLPCEATVYGTQGQDTIASNTIVLRKQSLTLRDLC